MCGRFKFVAILGLMAAIIGIGETANVLCVYTSLSPSHLIVNIQYARFLADAGHNVTVVTTIPLKDKNPRYHHLYIPASEEQMKIMKETVGEMTNVSGLMAKVQKTYNSIMMFSDMQGDVIKDQRFQDFLNNSDNKFDLLIVGYFVNDFQFGLAHHFDCPIIISWVAAANSIADRFVGNPPEIAYVPSSPMMTPPDPLLFTGRLKNFITAGLTKLMFVFADKRVDEIYRDLFPGYPSISEITKKRVSLLLANSHFSEGTIRPNVPAVIDVGGIQIKDKQDPLPEDLQVIFDASSEHGVIYLSFGTNIDSRTFDRDFFQKIYNALAGLKQTVLWKWDGEEKPGNAANIHYRKWLPQDDILAQPNLKLFITHAGKGGIAEAQYHAVPMVAIPMFAEQSTNAELMQNNGFGLALDHKTMTTETLKAAIMDVLRSPKYYESIKRFSNLYKDRPMTARETATYWLEYVIRHKGAYHMQSPLVHLNTLQYSSLDVVAFLLVVVFVIFKLFMITARFVFRKLFGKKSPANTEKVKRQ